jgi:hypothetical protein
MLFALKAAPYAGRLPTACFSVVADADPSIMPRVMALFAKRGLVPDYWCSRVSAGELTVDLQMMGMERDTAAYIAACFRQMPGVKAVLTGEKA